MSKLKSDGFDPPLLFIHKHDPYELLLGVFKHCSETYLLCRMFVFYHKQFVKL